MINRWWVLAGILLLILAGCQSAPENDKKADTAVAVVTDVVEQADFPVIVEIGGTLKGERQTTILSKVIATVDSIPVKIGQRVKKGDLLVAFDRDGVQSQYRQAEATYLNAEDNYRKLKNVFDAGGISESQFDAAETAYRVAQANFDAARQAVDIVAPFDGMIVDLPVDVGDEVMTGLPVVKIAEMKGLRLTLDVPTSVVGKLKVGQTVTVTSPADKNKTMTGRVTDVADAANPITRSFEVECGFDNPVSGFLPGMYLMADIQVGLLQQAMVVNNDALIYRTGQTYIYKVVDNIVQMQPIEILARGANKSAVEGDLQVGQKIVVVGQKNLSPGTPVREAEL